MGEKERQKETGGETHGHEVASEPEDPAGPPTPSLPPDEHPPLPRPQPAFHEDDRPVQNLQRLVGESKVPYRTVTEALEAALASASGELGAPDIEIGVLADNWLADLVLSEPRPGEANLIGGEVFLSGFVALGKQSLRALLGGSRSVRWLGLAGHHLCLAQPRIIGSDQLFVPHPTPRRSPTSGKVTKSLRVLIALLARDAGYGHDKQFQRLAKLLVDQSSKTAADHLLDPRTRCLMVLGAAIRWYVEEPMISGGLGSAETPNQSKVTERLHMLLEAETVGADISESQLRNGRVRLALAPEHRICGLSTEDVFLELQLAGDELKKKRPPDE